MPPPASLEHPIRRRESERISAAHLLAFSALAAITLSVLLGAVASFALASVVARTNRVELVYAEDIVAIERLHVLALEAASNARAHLLTGEPHLLEASEKAQKSLEQTLVVRRKRAPTPNEHMLIDAAEGAAKNNHASVARLFALRRAGGKPEDIAALFVDDVIPKLEALEVALDAYALFLDSRLEVTEEDARVATTRAADLVLAASAGAVALAATLGILLVRVFRKLRRGAEERLALLVRANVAFAEAELAQKNLAATVERLERVNADLDAFAGRVAHDLRNLLAPIALVPARLRIARDEGALERIAASLDRCVTRANAVLEGMLAFSRSGLPTDGPKSASVRDVVSQVTEELAPIAASVRATVELDVGDVRVACAPEMLYVVLLNLLCNALKFITASAERRIAVRASEAAGQVTILVEDTGPGIPAEALSRIFEPFYRVPGVSAPGTGIGLATVQRIVTAHGGEVFCRSTLGVGATFRVVLPTPPPSDSHES